MPQPRATSACMKGRRCRRRRIGEGKIAFAFNQQANISVQTIDSGVPAANVLSSTEAGGFGLEDWSRDGRYLMYSQGQGLDVYLWVLLCSAITSHFDMVTRLRTNIMACFHPMAGGLHIHPWMRADSRRFLLRRFHGPVRSGRFPMGRAENPVGGRTARKSTTTISAELLRWRWMALAPFSRYGTARSFFPYP
jgi:hypothetical protein